MLGLRELIKKEKKEGIRIRIPSHIAITTEGKTEYSKRNKIAIEEAYARSFALMKNVMKSQTRIRIPIVTFYILSSDMKSVEQFSILMDALANFFNELRESELVNGSKVKISVLGKWYDLPGRVVDSIKAAIDSTKNYDSFFTNFCINYDGREEIVDACKLIARQIKAGKLDPDSITKESIKESAYSSYFLPPDLIIRNGMKNGIPSLLLWDSVNAVIYFTKKLWPDFGKDDLIRAIEHFQSG